MASLSPTLCFAEVPQAAWRYRADLSAEARKVFGPTAPVALIAAMVHAESYWRETARSSAGAAGLGQFMDGTKQDLNARHPDLAALPAGSSRWQFRAMATYMRELMGKVGAFDCLERAAFGLSAYNGGLRWVYRRQELSDSPLFCLFMTCTINPGILPSNQAENERYSRRILLDLMPIYESWGPGACWS